MTQNSSNQDYSNEADGFKLAGGTTKRELSVTGADIALTGSGVEVYTFPASGGTLVTLESLYDVGDIFISTNSTNPSVKYGGTWVAFGEGKVLIGLDSGDTDFDTAEETGGSKTHNHSVNNAHAMVAIDGAGRTRVRQSSKSFTSNQGASASSTGGSSHTNAAELEGNTDSESNVPPYIVVYMFKRTA